MNNYILLARWLREDLLYSFNQRYLQGFSIMYDGDSSDGKMVLQLLGATSNSLNFANLTRDVRNLFINLANTAPYDINNTYIINFTPTKYLKASLQSLYTALNTHMQASHRSPRFFDLSVPPTDYGAHMKIKVAIPISFSEINYMFNELATELTGEELLYVSNKI